MHDSLYLYGRLTLSQCFVTLSKITNFRSGPAEAALTIKQSINQSLDRSIDRSISHRLIEDICSWQDPQLYKIKKINRSHCSMEKETLSTRLCLVSFITYLCKEDLWDKISFILSGELKLMSPWVEVVISLPNFWKEFA